ncbi:hypothetical protein Stsp02_08280 [Streptomyces sp. NBRC 14336]|nr:hypothetical protein Stsp02_08280 [Streptomyces sp. NBRC 14336]
MGAAGPLGRTGEGGAVPWRGQAPGLPPPRRGRYFRATPSPAAFTEATVEFPAYAHRQYPEAEAVVVVDR